MDFVKRLNTENNEPKTQSQLFSSKSSENLFNQESIIQNSEKNIWGFPGSLNPKTYYSQKFEEDKKELRDRNKFSNN